MGKRSDFLRIPKDRYMTTDPGPSLLLQPHLPRGTVFAEPCAGNGDLITSLEWFGHRCAYACDIKPGRRQIERRDAFTLDRRWRRSTKAEIFISNFPWTRSVLHPMIDHLSSLLPVWSLHDADWKHTRQAAPYLDYCAKIVSVGRVKWIEESDSVGVDNVCWYFFDRTHTGGPTFTGLTDMTTTRSV